MPEKAAFCWGDREKRRLEPQSPTPDPTASQVRLPSNSLPSSSARGASASTRSAPSQAGGLAFGPAFELKRDLRRNRAVHHIVAGAIPAPDKLSLFHDDGFDAVGGVKRLRRRGDARPHIHPGARERDPACAGVRPAGTAARGGTAGRVTSGRESTESRSERVFSNSPRVRASSTESCASCQGKVPGASSAARAWACSTEAREGVG
jgi:hypothetical protein